MSYRPRPYGTGPYGDDLYSQYDQPDLAVVALIGRLGFQAMASRNLGARTSLQARSGSRAWLNESALLKTGVLAGQSYSYAHARLYWEENPACSTVWTVRPPPPYVCPELEPV